MKGPTIQDKENVLWESLEDLMGRRDLFINHLHWSPENLVRIKRQIRDAVEEFVALGNKLVDDPRWKELK